MRSFLTLFALLFAALTHALSATGGDRLLVLLDDVADKEAYSTFLGDLEGRGFKTTYETPKSESLQLFHLGERTYDHILAFPTKIKGLGPNLTPNILADFIKADGNILISTSSSTTTPTSLVSLLAELDISLPAERTGLVVDHFNYDTLSAPDKHDVLLLPPPAPIRDGIKSFFQPESETSEVLAFPQAVGHVLGASPLLTPILRAPKTAYSYDPQDQGQVIEADELFAAGEQIGLVTAFQARNSARVTVVGSADMLSDKWFDAKVNKAGSGSDKVKTWNREFAKRVSGWTFHEIGVLRTNSVDHWLNDLQNPDAPKELNPVLYKVNDNVTYHVSISEWSWDKWISYVPPVADALQLEFSMLSPFWRLDLAAAETTPGATVYGVDFGLPDKHGIFNFMFNYKRPFLTNIEEKRTVSLRHIAHDEFPRPFFITGAWPYVSGIWVTVAGFLAFSAVWLYCAPEKKAGGAKKTQ